MLMTLLNDSVHNCYHQLKDEQVNKGALSKESRATKNVDLNIIAYLTSLLRQTEESLSNLLVSSLSYVSPLGCNLCN